MLPYAVPRRAVLIFADDAKTDLARRAFPTAILPLLTGPKVEGVAADAHFFTRSLGAADDKRNVHQQIGRNFAERFENALETIRSLGYEQIVAVGRDCPSLCARDISFAFEQLETHRIVLGPDHRGGCYLIAFRTEELHLLRGIRWEKNTDCEQLQNRCRAEEVLLLPVKHDLDSWADLAILARGSDWIAQFASSLLEFVPVAGDVARSFVDLARQFVRVRGQMPPPAFVG